MSAPTILRVLISLTLMICVERVLSDGDKEVFARLGDAVISHELLDAAFSRIPVRDRLTFIRDGQKVQNLVNQLLVNQLIANQARQAEFDQQPHVMGRIKFAADKTLADAWLDEVVRNAPDADYEQLAKEYYLVNQQDFKTGLRYDVTHLLVSTGERSDDEARALAREFLEQAQASPESFNQLVVEHSDDPSVNSNKGRYTDVPLGKMVTPFEQASIALEQPGMISGLVQTQFGFHIIRLDGKQQPRQQSFDEVKTVLMNIQKTDYLEKVKTRYIRELIGQPMEVPEDAVEKMLKRHFGEDLGQAPE